METSLGLLLGENLFVVFSLLFLLFLSAFFSASETAITAIGHARLTSLQEKYSSYKRLIDWLLTDAQRALMVCLVANNVVNIGASVMATIAGVALFGAAATIYVVPVMSVLIIIFGEILPKSTAMIYPGAVLLVCLPILRLMAMILSPFVWLLQKIVYVVGMIFRIDLKNQQTFMTRDEIERMVNIGEQNGVFEEVERKMIHGIISFEETRAYEIMVPRTDMVAISKDDTLQEAISIFIEHGHSRLPVYDETPDSIIGILYVKDTLPFLTSGQVTIPVEKMVRKPMFVPESIRTDDLFKLMKKDRVHMAIAVDEYGGVAGIVTMEDILEEIVGEIQDEYDEETPEIQREDNGTWLVNGLASLEDLSEALMYPFESEDAESIGGLVLSLAGNFPEGGEEFHYGDWTIQVVEVEDHRIKLLRLIPENASA